MKSVLRIGIKLMFTIRFEVRSSSLSACPESGCPGIPGYSEAGSRFLGQNFGILESIGSFSLLTSAFILLPTVHSYAVLFSTSHSCLQPSVHGANESSLSINPQGLRFLVRKCAISSFAYLCLCMKLVVIILIQLLATSLL